MKNFGKLLFLILLLAPLISLDARSKHNLTNDGNSDKVIAGELKAVEDSLQSKSYQPIDITASETDSNAVTFSAGKIIEVSDTVRQNVVVKGGNLTILGLVDGNVLVVGGDLILKSTGRINGNARVIDGNILKDSTAVIKGYEDRTSTEKTAYRETPRRFSRSGLTFDVPWQDEQTNLEKFVFRYNRVESLFLGLGTEKKFYWNGRKKWNAYGSIGWGFKSHTWRGNLGLSRQFAIQSDKSSGIIEVGAEVYTLTDTKDQWIISLHENTASAFLIHEDYRDYFERRGYTIHAAYYLMRDYLKGELKLSFLVDSYDSLSNKVDWALFGGNKKFRTNPAIDPGNMRSLMFLVGISTTTRTSFGPEGWGAFATTEFAKSNWNSEFDFDQYILDVRRFQPLGKYENLNVRLRVGSAYGTLPPQKLYELGGLGTMNAFPFKSEIGNRMMLVNMEFIVNGNILDDLDFWPTWIFDHVNIMLTSDAGFTRAVPSNVSATSGFSDIKWNEFKHNFGIALSNRPGSFRIGFAWRTDHPAPVHFLLRFSRPF